MQPMLTLESQKHNSITVYTYKNHDPKGVAARDLDATLTRLSDSRTDRRRTTDGRIGRERCLEDTRDDRCVFVIVSSREKARARDAEGEAGDVA